MKLELQLFLFHSGSVIGLTDAHEFFGSGACALESFDHALSANGIIAGQDWLSILHACDDGLSDVAAESAQEAGYLFSKREQATKLQNVIGFMGLFSLRVYRLIFYSMRAENVWISVPRPPSPIIMLSCILKTLWKSLVMVSNYFPNLRSQAMPTQSLPTIPTRVPPLYSSIDIVFQKQFKSFLLLGPLINQDITELIAVKGYRHHQLVIYWDYSITLLFVLLLLILDRVKDSRNYLPFDRVKPCRNPIASRLFSIVPRSARHIQRSFPFNFQSISYMGHPVSWNFSFISCSCAGEAIVMQRISEGGFMLFDLNLNDLLYSQNYQPSASLRRLRVSQ